MLYKLIALLLLHRRINNYPPLKILYYLKPAMDTTKNTLSILSPIIDMAADLRGPETIIAPFGKKSPVLNAQLKLALRVRNKQIKKLSKELVAARAGNHDFTLRQNELYKEKEQRAAELIIANKELIFQNGEKEKRAAELLIANSELVFQNEEKEKRAAELIVANNELEAFSFIASHDLQEPLRKIQTFSAHLLEKENENLSTKGKDYVKRMQSAARRMQQLINDLLAYSRITINDRKFERTDLNHVIEEVKDDLKEAIDEKNAIIEVDEIYEMLVNPFQFHQLMYNLLSNALKFSKPVPGPHITIRCSTIKGHEILLPEKTYCHITVSDNGIGFQPEYNELIFGVFQKLHGVAEYTGTGIGLAIVKKIIENHNGLITASGELDKGARFDIYIPFAETR